MNLDFLHRTGEFNRLLEAVGSGRSPITVRGLIEPAKAYFTASLAAAAGRPVVFISGLAGRLSSFESDCRFFAREIGSDLKVASFPALFENPYFEVPPSLDAVSQRMRFFNGILRRRPGVVVTNLAALLKPVPRREDLESYFFRLEVEAEADRDEFLAELERFGYVLEDIVASRGEYARRGCVVDVFPPWETDPFRIEFGASEVASIRQFDASTQRSIRKVQDLVVPSLREFPVSEEFLGSWSEAARSEWGGRRDLKDKLASVAAREFRPTFPADALLSEERFTPVSGYLGDAVYLLDRHEETEKEWLDHSADLDSQYADLASDQAAVIEPGRVFLPGEWERLRGSAVRLDGMDSGQGEGEFVFGFQSVPRFENKLPFFLEYLRKLQTEGELCFIYLANQATRKRLGLLLAESDIPCVEVEPGGPLAGSFEIMLLIGPLGKGFSMPRERVHVFSERDVFTEERITAGRVSKRPSIADFHDINAGDHVVHSEYGVGVFLGLQRVGIEGGLRDFLEIGYRDGDKLLVPVEDLNLIQKYSRTGTDVPILDKLGTNNWDKTKAKVRKAVEAVAAELVELYAKRKAQKGFTFATGEWEEEFDRTFDFQETEDQLRSIRETRQDMESDTPMDRLLCGDVGYGKTEVAMRAAFKAVMDGKQVAVLCPTTLLADQHIETFRARMALFPVRIEGLTRFQTGAEAAGIVKDVNQGFVDILIGTHRILSADVAFKDLGLLIIDEEQRFGVGQKEKIKRLRSNIDVLTMTATPIPRTLNLSMVGLRDISLIETPPQDRLAVHTVVTPFNAKLIGTAIKQELARGGQVFYVHNRIDDIDTVVAFLEKLVPEARVVSAHGRTPASVLEKRMMGFVTRQFNVLVSTTIIENGIDIPMVNTLIVDRADTYGLAQLYQLRGRVGRSSRQAFAYFLVPSYTGMSPLAKERLKALKEFSELGSGFRLAAKDLEIRGAGTMLGHRQHGSIEAVGFDYYMQLLDQAVKKFKGERVETCNPEIRLKSDIRIPDEYVPQVNVRLNLYKKIASAGSLAEIDRLREEMGDRFGPPPAPVDNLLLYGAVKHLARRLGLASVDRVETRVLLKFTVEAPIEWPRIPAFLKEYRASLSPEGVMTITPGKLPEKRFLEETIRALKTLSGYITMNEENRPADAA